MALTRHLAGRSIQEVAQVAQNMETLEDRYEGLMLSRTDPDKPSGRALRLLDICRELVVGVTRAPFVEGDGCLEDWDEVVRDFVLRYAAGIHVDLGEWTGHESRRKDAAEALTKVAA
jgi:hypothetical protein